jgi:enolase
MAVAKAAAEASGLPLYRYLGGSGAKTLPVPMLNILNGGKHADNTVDFQEFMIQPWGFDNFAEACGRASRSTTRSRRSSTTTHLSTAVGDEGGFAPNLKSNEDALQDHREGRQEGRLQVGRADLRRPRPRDERVLERGRERREEVGYKMFKSTKEVVSAATR